MSIQRDFELLDELLKEEEPPMYKEGDIYDVNAPRVSGECTGDCSFFKLQGTAKQPMLFCCKEHSRIHICGNMCTHKILSHESISCEWTGEDMEEKLIAEHVNQQMTMVPCLFFSSSLGEPPFFHAEPFSSQDHNQPLCLRQTEMRASNTRPGSNEYTMP